MVFIGTFYSFRFFKFCVDFIEILVFTQEEIHELLLSFAEAGATVVRLKGGDPLVSFRVLIKLEFCFFCCFSTLHLEAFPA